MAAGPQRRERGIPHLNAHIVPVERALGAVADKLDAEAEETPGGEPITASEARTLIGRTLRDVAEEAHHW